MKKSRKNWGSVLLIGCCLQASLAFGWGERGHHLICQTATRLVRNPALKSFLELRGHIMGHLCNVPDISWRNIGPQAHDGNYTHYMSPDSWGGDLAALPLKYSEVTAVAITKSPDLKNAIEVHRMTGSNWWRADQFYRLAVAAGQEAVKFYDKGSQADVGKDTPYDSAVQSFINNLGLMGHFVGDNSMPYHVTADYDGWNRGHGGIHFYYESLCTEALPLDLARDVEKQAQRLSKSMKAGRSLLERMKEQGVLSYQELAQVEKLDHLESPQVPSLEEIQRGKDVKNSSQRTAPKRPPHAQQSKVFKKLMVSELARSAALLAQLWDEAYVAAGSPNLTQYRNWRYPFQPDYVAPDYVEKDPQ